MASDKKKVSAAIWLNSDQESKGLVLLTLSCQTLSKMFFTESFDCFNLENENKQELTPSNHTGEGKNGVCQVISIQMSAL